MAAGIAGVFLEIGYSGRRPDSLAGTQCGSGVLGPQDGFFREGERRFFFPDVQHGRFLHVFRPLVAEGDSVVENAGAEAEAGIIPGNHVFVKMDGSGGVFAARFKGVADVVLHFFHAPSRNAASKKVAPVHPHLPRPEGLQGTKSCFPFSGNGRSGYPRGASRTDGRPGIAERHAILPPVGTGQEGILPYC